MAVPAAALSDLEDKHGRPVHVGSNVRVAGITEPVEVHQIDARYGILVVLVPGRAGQRMGKMVRAEDVEVV
jgi:hypothetical protein